MDDGLWHPEDYDDVPRSNGNFGLDPFQQACQDAEDARLLALKHSNPRDGAVSPAAEKGSYTITPDEAGARIAATWAFSELAWSELMDHDQVSFQTDAPGLVIEIRNGQKIPCSRVPGDSPVHVDAMVEHMANLEISTWSGTGKEVKAIVANAPPLR